MTFAAVLDANVLVPARVRDVLLTLAEAGLYRPLWSDLILDEVGRHLPATMDDVARKRLVSAMAGAFPEAVVQWPNGLTFDALSVVNDKDRHVVTAALHAGADVVVTEDTDLRDEGLRLGASLPVDLDFQGCAEFTAYAVDADREAAREALDRMLVARWRLVSDDRWPRFLAWADRQGWATTTDVLRQV